MNRRLYTKLAWTGIKKNKQLYYPYLIAGTAMVMIFYILAFLGASGTVHGLKGGEAVTQLLSYGSWAIGLFSLPFLFYTSSSLIKKRKKELGLYNILGMNKKNILFILFWEMLMSYGIAVVAGIHLGIIFSKAAELGIVNIMGERTDYSIHVEWKAILSAVLFYAVIYVLIFLNTMRQIHHNNPIELLRSESLGERPPRSSWLLASAGAVMTLYGYMLAAQIKNPQTALSRSLFLAVLIAGGTYLLFIAGSVFLCRALQKNTQYYYQPAHFVTVSSLSYRMKRNGAGLASICVLATLILVALVSSVGFYAGAGSIIRKHYPFDLSVSVEVPGGMADSAEFYGKYRAQIEDAMKSMSAEISETEEIFSAGLCAPVENGVLDLSYDLAKDAPESGKIEEWNAYLSKFSVVRVVSLDDYNRLCSAREELGEHEVLIAGAYGNTCDSGAKVRNWDGREYTVRKIVKEVPELSGLELYNGFTDTMIEQIFLVVPDLETFWGDFDPQAWISKNQVRFLWEYDVTLAEDRDRQLMIGDTVNKQVQQLAESEGNTSYTCNVREEKGDKLNGLAGGLMFLAVVISVVFVFAATLIMYYKQISEGYEDQRQFAVMRKIGMTKKEIRRSINSQMLTVFSFPLIAAGIHLIFALPVIYQLMKYAVLDDIVLLIKVAAVSFLMFAVVYSAVYVLTTRTYFKIVNRAA